MEWDWQSWCSVDSYDHTLWVCVYESEGCRIVFDTKTLQKLIWGVDQAENFSASTPCNIYSILDFQ